MAGKAWKDMTAEERRAWRIDRWRNPDVAFASTEAEADYEARMDRVVKAIDLEQPEQVPVRLNTGFWPATSAGLTAHGAVSDAVRGAKAWKDFNLKFQPDLSCDPVHNTVPASMFEVIADLPKGTTVWLFDQTDMARAKETIGQVACIQGNVPLSLMHAGTAEEVAGYTRKVIDQAGAGGGFILDFGAVADEGKDENLHVMMKTAREYGVY